MNNVAGTTNELSQSYFENNTLEIQPVAELSVVTSGRQNKRQLEDDNSDNGNEFCFLYLLATINFYCK